MGKKATAFFLIGAFALNVAGYVDAYHFMFNKRSSCHQSYLKKQQKERVLTRRGEAGLAAKGFKRKAKGEYSYHGKWYDVVKKESKGASTIFYLVHDSREEELLHFLESFLTSHPASKSNRATVILTHNLLRQYLPALKNVSIVSPKQENEPLSYITPSPSPPYIAIVLPPPKWIG